MEPEVSAFQTGFLTEAGNINTSKQYYAFVEKEGLACWIVAEQIDTDDKESAKLAAEQLILDFSQKPTLNRIKLKEYLTNAHQKLVNESQNIMLKASLVMVVSDYAKMVWAVSGNVRLYHFRDGVFNFRSKDQTMAQVMLDAGNLKEEDINRRNERSGLINYLGISTEFKPLVSQAYCLHEGDKILLCNLGLWEKVSVRDLEQVLEAKEEPAELLTRLRENWLAKSDKPLKQFIGTFIYVNKIERKKIGNYLTSQNIMTGLAVVAIVGAGFLASQVFSNFNKESLTKKTGRVTPAPEQPIVTARLSQKPKKIAGYKEARPTLKPKPVIQDETKTFLNQNQTDETGKLEGQSLSLRRENTSLTGQPPETTPRPRHQKPAAAKGQPETEGRDRKLQGTVATVTKQTKAEEPQRRRKAPETLEKQPERPKQSSEIRVGEGPKKQPEIREPQRRPDEEETLKQQREAEEQQLRQKEVEDLKKQQDATEQQRRRKEAEAERRRKLKEAEVARKQQDGETKKSTTVPEVDRPQRGGPLAESSSDIPLTKDAKIVRATTLEKTGDEKYDSQKYSEALDLYKLAKRTYVELGMALEASRVDQKINITIKKKLEHFLKNKLKQ